MADYGPHDTWPSHDGKEVDAALDQAKQAGFTLRQPAGHWGTLFCPCGNRDHKAQLYATARGPRDGSHTAKFIRGEIRRFSAEHASEIPDQLKEPEETIEQLLKRANILCSSYEDLVAAQRFDARAERTLAAGIASGGDDDDVLEEAEQLTRRAAHSDARSQAFAARYGLAGPPWPPERGAAVLRDEACKALLQARKALSTGQTDVPEQLVLLEQRLDQATSADHGSGRP